LERRLLDAVATTPGTAASAWQDVCGVVGAAPTPALPAVWVVWQLADRAQAEAFQCRLAAWLPTAECGHFTATAAPDGGLHAALAEAAQHRA
jgi:hypothetical protein